MCRLTLVGLQRNTAEPRRPSPIFPPSTLSTIRCRSTPAASGFWPGITSRNAAISRIPVVAVGLIYSRGYVTQKLRDDGWQEDQEEKLDRSYDPIQPVLDREQRPAYSPGAAV